MSRWSAPSSDDYYDEVESARRPTEYDVTCILCGAHFTVRADNRPPYRCDGCQSIDAVVAPARERTAR
jgi:hypothetical protein